MSGSVFSHYMCQGYFSISGDGGGGVGISCSHSLFLLAFLSSLSFWFVLVLGVFLASSSCSLMKPFCTTYIQMLLSVLRQPASLTMKCE